ncbi:MAG: hypothetical protein HY272_00405 [Gammaproteobacteria bacterium]|nr:hypothetical protein [Gammaproteobacteria bacterium]
MSIITVYSFSYHDKEQGIQVIGSGKFQREKIAEKDGWNVIESSAEDVDSSLLTSEGRYYPAQ